MGNPEHGGDEGGDFGAIRALFGPFGGTVRYGESRGG